MEQAAAVPGCLAEDNSCVAFWRRVRLGILEEGKIGITSHRLQEFQALHPQNHLEVCRPFVYLRSCKNCLLTKQTAKLYRAFIPCNGNQKAIQNKTKQNKKTGKI